MTASEQPAPERVVTYSPRGFWALIATQFQGAFNDNAYRFVIVFFLLGLAGKSSEGHTSESDSAFITGMATVLFSIPFLLFPSYAGAFSDRFSKRFMTIATKWWEIGVMLVGLVAFIIEFPPLIWAMLFMMATQSAFFSPAKYGMMPELLPESKLSWGNGILQMGTLVAIIAGTAVAGVLMDKFPSITFISLFLITLSVLGLFTSVLITPLRAANPKQGIPLLPWSGTARCFGVFWRDKWLFLTMLGLGYFWFAGALIQNNIVLHGKTSMLLEGDTMIALLQAAMALGIGAGSVAAGYLSRGKIEGGLVPIGALGMTVFCGLLAVPGWGYGFTLFLLFGMGFSGGFFDVPLAATLQHRSPEELRGGMIATSNLVTFAGISLAGGVFLYLGVNDIQVNSYYVFLGTAILSLTVGIYICWLMPMFLLRFLLWAGMSTVYRIRALRTENIPQQGGALLVANHMSFVDALFIIASIDRPIRFIMSKDLFEKGWVRPFAKIMQAIPISAMSSPRELIQSMRAATEALENGDLVCIFAEGQITRTGQMLPFKKGLERITKDVDVPIVPVFLDRLWGSVFSFSDQKFFLKWPRKIPFPVTICYGEAMPGNSSAVEVREAIQLLGSEAVMTHEHDLLQRQFVRMARKYPRHMAMADQRTPHLSLGKALIGSIVMARKLRPHLDEREMVGVVLPASVGGGLANVALQLMGKVAVNLNFTASKEALHSSAKQCNLKHIITAKAFLEKMPLDLPCEPIYLEDIMGSVTGKDRITSMLMAFLLPVKMLERMLGAPRDRSPQDLLTVIFSSGSEGDPKGVMLTHYNLASNIEAALQVIQLDRNDTIMGFLPFFHSFGYIAALWIPLTRGVKVVYHANPLEAKVIGQLVHKYKITFLVSTPTFLQAYIRRCAPEEFSSLRYVITGAEKLPARIREAFKNKFGIEPLEGYGTTELSPGVSFNVPDYRAPGFYQVATKHGTIGHPLPGISARVMDPDTHEVLAQGEEGLLCIKGPNVMKGYLGMPEKTAEVLVDDWYNTGDIAKIDEEGFITITDRLSRFSKIGGEMVPHTKIEETLHKLLELTDQEMAVVGIPDESKGEKLVVLHTLQDGLLESLVERLEDSDLPNLWRPRANAFYKIDELPVLGSGKLDLKALKKMATEMDIGE
jgi:acyl-[acyl-carrier-protein]-phospholipid O-acyltransferase / long-chain-fatty-acid--[acyl-carrier-protein] ligase